MGHGQVPVNGLLGVITCSGQSEPAQPALPPSDHQRMPAPLFIAAHLAYLSVVAEEKGREGGELDRRRDLIWNTSET